MTFAAEVRPGPTAFGVSQNRQRRAIVRDYNPFETDYEAALDQLRYLRRKVGCPFIHPKTGQRRCRVDGLALDDETIIRDAFGDTEFSRRILNERGQK